MIVKRTISPFQNQVGVESLLKNQASLLLKNTKAMNQLEQFLTIISNLS